MKYFAAILLLFGLATTSQAQITITADDFIRMHSVSTEDYFAIDSAEFAPYAADSGSNKTWDLSGKNYQQSDSAGSELIDPADAPLANDAYFKQATHVFRSPTGDGSGYDYEYMIVTDTALWYLGSASTTGGSLGEVQKFTPPYLDMKFPLTYGTAWKDTAQIYDSSFGSTFVFMVDAKVDGYGQLTLPGSKPLDALRLRMAYTVSFGGFNITDYNILWITKSGFGETIKLDSNQQPQQVSYTAPKQAAVNGPRSSSLLYLQLSSTMTSVPQIDARFGVPGDCAVIITLTDALGRTLYSDRRMALAGENTRSIDIASLASGTYFVHVATPSGALTEKLVVSR